MTFLLAFLLEFVWALVATLEVLSIADKRPVAAALIAGLNCTTATLIVWLIAETGPGLIFPLASGNVLATYVAVRVWRNSTSSSIERTTRQ